MAAVRNVSASSSNEKPQGRGGKDGKAPSNILSHRKRTQFPDVLQQAQGRFSIQSCQSRFYIKLHIKFQKLL